MMHTLEVNNNPPVSNVCALCHTLQDSQVSEKAVEVGVFKMGAVQPMLVCMLLHLSWPSG